MGRRSGPKASIAAARREHIRVALASWFEENVRDSTVAPHAAVESLCKDGLAKVSPESADALATGMVAEERAPYGVGLQDRSLEQKVSLP